MEKRRVGSYLLVRHLGTGGMASVYEAVHEPEGLRAAIKLLHPDYAKNPDVAARFLNEARAANSVDHPGIVRIYDSGILPDGVAYLSMEYVDGVSLLDRMQKLPGRMSQAHAVQLGQQLALALAALHQRGIVHRDLKPENLMLVADPSVPGGERVKILDFGIAKLAAGTAGPGAEVTRTGMLLGTPTYMSPEQCRGSRSVDAKADVYALGVILYQLLGGQPPFIGSGAADVMTMHLFEQPAPLSSLAEVSPRLGRLVHQMLHKSPAERPSMAQVAARLADELLPIDQSDDQTKMTHRLEDEPPQVQPRLAHLSLPQLVMPTMVSRTAPDLKRPEELGQPSTDSLRTLHRARTLRIVATLVAITTAILFASILLLVMLRR